MSCMVAAAALLAGCNTLDCLSQASTTPELKPIETPCASRATNR